MVKDRNKNILFGLYVYGGNFTCNIKNCADKGFFTAMFHIKSSNLRNCFFEHTLCRFHFYAMLNNLFLIDLDAGSIEIKNYHKKNDRIPKIFFKKGTRDRLINSRKIEPMRISAFAYDHEFEQDCYGYSEGCENKACLRVSFKLEVDGEDSGRIKKFFCKSCLLKILYGLEREKRESELLEKLRDDHSAYYH